VLIDLDDVHDLVGIFIDFRDSFKSDMPTCANSASDKMTQRKNIVATARRQLLLAGG